MKNKEMDCNYFGEIGIVRNGDFYRIQRATKVSLPSRRAIFVNHSARFVITVRVRHRSGQNIELYETFFNRNLTFIEKFLTLMKLIK